MQDQRASVASQSDSLSGSEEDREEIIFSVCVFCLVVFNLSLFHLTMLDYEIFFFFFLNLKISTGFVVILHLGNTIP